MAFENNLSIKNINVEVKSSPTSAKVVSDTTSSDVPIIRKKEPLTQEQRTQMELMGLNPENEYHRSAYLAMSPEEIKRMLDEILAKQNGASVAKHEHQHVEHKHNFVIDFESDEWKNADAQGKLLYLMTQGAKQNFTEEAWNKLSERQKNIERDKFLNEEFSVHNSEWESADETKKLTIISEFLNDYMLAEDLNMTLSELFAFKTHSPDKYAKAQDRFFADNKKIDLVAEKEKAKTKHIENIQAAKNNYEAKLEEFLKNEKLILAFNNQYIKENYTEYDKYQAKNKQYKQLIDLFYLKKDCQLKIIVKICNYNLIIMNITK